MIQSVQVMDNDIIAQGRFAMSHYSNPSYINYS